MKFLSCFCMGKRYNRTAKGAKVSQGANSSGTISSIAGAGAWMLRRWMIKRSFCLGRCYRIFCWPYARYHFPRERDKVMSKGWKIEPPDVPKELQDGQTFQTAVECAVAETEEVRGMRFTDDALAGICANTLDFTGCVFERCIFGECDVERLSFVDCVFEKCEWTNAQLMGFTCQRVKFHQCRMTGLEWMRSALFNTAFEGCTLDYACFSETKMDRVNFEMCRMRESLWADVKLPRVRFDSADLSKAQWMRTPLAGIDMSTSTIDGWSISLFDLKGMKVTAAQVIELSGLLGVEIVP